MLYDYTCAIFNNGNGGVVPGSNGDYSGGNRDLSSIRAMATYSFGPAISDNDFVKRKLEAVVERLSFQARRKCSKKINVVHNILAEFGLNIKGFHKRELIRLFFEASFILILYKDNIHEELMLQDTYCLIERYPDFATCGNLELNKLLRFRNLMTIALQYIPPAQNRDYLLDLITRISEGRDVRYVPGSGATPLTQNRLLIYRTEGQVRMKPRPPRRSHLFDNFVPANLPHLNLKRGRSLDESPDSPTSNEKAQKFADVSEPFWIELENQIPISDLFEMNSIDESETDELDCLLQSSNGGIGVSRI